MPNGIESFIHRKIVVLREDTPASQAARAMCDNKIGCVLVADARASLTGIVTDRDLACGLVASRSDVDTPLVELMTPEPAWAKEDASIEEVVDVMERNGVRRIPIVQQRSDKKLHCVGLISVDDLIASQTIEPIRLSRIIQAQIRQAQIRRGAIRGVRRLFANHRSEAHREQTLDRFYKVVREKAEISEAKVGPVVQGVLAMLIRRMHYTGAAHFIAQLPVLLQEDLLSLPAGPDRSIDLDSMVGQVQRVLESDESDARDVLYRFGRALATLIDPSEIEHIRAQLPKDIQSLFFQPDRLSIAGK